MSSALNTELKDAIYNRTHTIVNQLSKNYSFDEEEALHSIYGPQKLIRLENLYLNTTISMMENSNEDNNEELIESVSNHLPHDTNVMSSFVENKEDVSEVNRIITNDIDSRAAAEPDDEQAIVDESEINLSSRNKIISSREVNKPNNGSADQSHYYTQEYKQLERLWNENLLQHGVKLPGCKSKLGFSLIILYDNLGNYVHIDDIKLKVGKRFKMTGTDPLQVRHLNTQNGWWIEKDGKYKFKLVSVTQPMPGYIPEKRKCKLDVKNWEEIKNNYNNQCVNCGSKEGEPLRWKPTELTKLQQGHMDPRKDLTNDNCIPQCQFCNQQYKNKAVFNKRGVIIDYCRTGF